MNRLASLVTKFPQLIGDYLRYDYRPALTLASLDFSSVLLPEPVVISTALFTTLPRPQNLVILNGGLVARCAVDQNARIVTHQIQEIEPNDTFYLDNVRMGNNVAYMILLDGQLLFITHSSTAVHGDQIIPLEETTISIFCICAIPTGFVICSAGDSQSLLRFYENGKCTKTLVAVKSWSTMTWIRQGDIAFVATIIQKHYACIYLLSIDGSILKEFHHAIPNETMGMSVTYDPRWDEYIVSGEKRIIGFSPVGVRTIYEHTQPCIVRFVIPGSLPCIHSLTWHDRTLFACILNQHSILRLEMK